jgi:uncharacterized protein
MKQFLFICILVIKSVITIAQPSPADFFSKGDSLYDRKEYLLSGRNYTTALQMMGRRAKPTHHWYAAQSWSLAGRADSAFYHLQQAAQHDSVEFSQYSQINADEDLETLHSDARWRPLMGKMLQHTLRNQITILPNTQIPMRDGIRLNATVYKPSVQHEKLPVIFTLTPYIGDSYHDRGTWFAKRGFVYVIVDARGRGSSEGVFYPFRNEAKDGHDIVSWLSRQSFSNGKVAMWGGSYAGFDQWATAKTFPANLATIVPAAAVMPGTDFPMVNNIFYPYAIQWLTLTGGHNYNENLFSDRSYWDNKFAERFIGDVPFAKLDSVVGYPNKAWKDYMKNPSNGPYYKAMTPVVVDYRRMQLPVLTITGAYDGDQTGALSYYKAFMLYASPTARQLHYLLIGPWDHAGTRTPQKLQQGVAMGDSSLVDMNQLHADWYNHVMRDSALPSLLRDHVVYYVAGADRWKTAARLEDIGHAKQSLFLNATYGRTGMEKDSGRLETAAPTDAHPGAYTFNPLEMGRRYFVQYDGPVLEQELTIAGVFELDLYLQTNVKDIDIRADVSEYTAEGKRIPLTSQTMRARYRNSMEKETLLTPGETTLLHFNRFNFIARRLAKGSRLRLIVSTPSQHGDEINYCSGGVVQQETRKDAQVAEVKFMNHSGANSLLRVPLAD